MMCIDLGGPINKVAYSFAVAGLGAGSITDQTPWEIMAAVMAAGMVPPLALALASTVIDRRLFSPAERENGKAAWLLGAAFISEGAIPFAAVDPLRVIPASIVGGAVTGAMVMGLGVVSQAPHGGVFVLFAMNGIPRLPRVRRGRSGDLRLPRRAPQALHDEAPGGRRRDVRRRPGRPRRGLIPTRPNLPVPSETPEGERP